MRSSPARLRRVEVLPQLGELGRQLAFVHRVAETDRARSSRAGGAGRARAAGRAPASGCPPRCRLDRPRRREHRRQCRASPDSAHAGVRSACVHRPAARRASPRAAAAAVRGPAIVRPRCGWRRALSRRSPRGSAESRRARSNRSARRPRPAAATRRERAAIAAAAAAPQEEQQVPPEEKGFLQVAGHAGCRRAGFAGLSGVGMISSGAYHTLRSSVAGSWRRRPSRSSAATRTFAGEANRASFSAANLPRHARCMQSPIDSATRAMRPSRSRSTGRILVEEHVSRNAR